jgi:hypothetical protein
VVGKFDDCELYLNEKTVEFPLSAMGIGVWNDPSDTGPTFYYLKQGLVETKY